jgi:WD40 repeat protein
MVMRRLAFLMCAAALAAGAALASAAAPQRWLKGSGGLLRDKGEKDAQEFVNGAVFSPDGSAVLTSYAYTFDVPVPDKVRLSFALWDTENGKNLWTLTEEELPKHRFAAFFPGGKQFLVRHGDALEVRDAATGKAVRTLTDDAKQVESVAISSDGKSVLVGNRDGTIELLDAADGRRVRKFNGVTGGASIYFSPNVKLALSVSQPTNRDENTVRLWRVATGETIVALPIKEGWGTVAAFSPDTEFAVVGRTKPGEGRRNLVLLDLPTLQEKKTFDDDANRAAFTAKGKQLVTANTHSGELALWSVRTGEKLQTMDMRGKDYTGSLTAAALSADGELAFSAEGNDNRKRLRVWDAVAGKLICELDEQKSKK